MNRVKIVFVFIFALSTIGCSVTGPIIADNGYTYYVNSSDCARYQYWSDNKAIQCFDEDGKSTGYRYPMTQESLNAYYRKQEQIEKSFDDLNNSLERNNQIMQEQFNQNMRTYELQRLNNNINCIGKPFCTTY